jgi:protein-S-isoprenylcysteine O-methyltransferase Ste14
MMSLPPVVASLAAVFFLAMLAVYSKAARVEEALFTGTDLATSYASYRLRTPMFMPGIHF